MFTEIFSGELLITTLRIQKMYFIEIKKYFESRRKPKFENTTKKTNKP